MLSFSSRPSVPIASRYFKRRFRGSAIRLFLSVCSVIAGVHYTTAQTKSLTWRWMNTPCGNVLNCNTGCTACNLPDETDNVFFGTNAAWIGVSTCPHPFSAGDNAVFSEGWDLQPEAGRYVLLSGISLMAVSLDSIALRHRNWDGGPTRLRISLRRELNGELELLYDGEISDVFQTVALHDLGCVEAKEDMSYGSFQLMFQAYSGNDGAWVLDEVRVVASPCATDITTGIALQQQQAATQHTQRMDMLGRAVGSSVAAGSYQQGARRVVVQ